MLGKPFELIIRINQNDHLINTELHLALQTLFDLNLQSFHV